jgi:hypothetical protein
MAIALAMLSVSALVASGPATAASATTTPTDGLIPITIPGLHDPSYNLTLITGDQVKLTAAGGGRYTATATPTITSPMINIRAHGGRTGTKDISAIPFAAQSLIASGALDHNLFDLTWLAAHGDTGAHAHIPVTVQYVGHPSATTLKRSAAALTGATVLAAHADTGAVDLDVNAAAAATFWAHLTGISAPGLASATAAKAPHLTGGATRAWPTGHQTAATPQPATTQPLYHVTITVKYTTGDTFRCNGAVATMCAPNATLYGVAGDGADNGYGAPLVCVDDPCTTMSGSLSVPAGVYTADSFAFTMMRSVSQPSQIVYLNDPQLTVAGDTSLTFDVSTAQKITIGTPRPSQPFTGVLNSYRTTASGGYAYSGALSLFPSYWATPTNRVTIGTYHLTTDWILGKPKLTMSVTAPQRLNLDATYWTYRDDQTSGPLGEVQFDGQQNLQLVDAGYGRAEDFAGLDARGKLVLMRIQKNGKGSHGETFFGCSGGAIGIVLDSQLDNAIQAGAAAVLIDPVTPDQDPALGDDWCGWVMSEAQYFPDGPQPNMPFAAIPEGQANTLIGLLGQHTVKVDVSGYSGNSPYLYTPTLSEEGHIPASLHTTLTDSQLTTVVDHHHSDQPAVTTLFFDSWAPSEWFGLGDAYEHFTTPADVIQYRGPASPSTLYQRATNGVLIDDVLTQPGVTTSDDWNAEPFAPGAMPPSSDVFQAKGGRVLCAFCRQGNTFYPMMYQQSGADPKVQDGLYGFATNAIHLYHDGQEIEPTPALGAASYQLPAEQARYQLVTHYGDTSISWDFTSKAPSSNQVGDGYVCVKSLFGSNDPCAADPLVLLRYNANTSLSNTVTAPGAQQLQITGYHQAADGPAIRSMKVWTSVDAGKTWQKATVTGGAGGAYTATYIVPDLSETNGAVSIKAQATDAGGNDITQIILNAVKLAPRTPGAQ